MAAITKEQIKRIYALGAGAGILERGNKDDNLHMLICSITGMESISALTAGEFKTVERELLTRMRLSHRSAPLKSDRRRAVTKPPVPAGMMTPEQQGLAWRLIYRLCELDDRAATPGDRLRGAIRKILGMEVALKEPMWYCKPYPRMITV